MARGCYCCVTPPPPQPPPRWVWLCLSRAHARKAPAITAFAWRPVATAKFPSPPRWLARGLNVISPPSRAARREDEAFAAEAAAGSSPAGSRTGIVPDGCWLSGRPRSSALPPGGLPARRGLRRRRTCAPPSLFYTSFSVCFLSRAWMRVGRGEPRRRRAVGPGVAHAVGISAPVMLLCCFEPI